MNRIVTDGEAKSRAVRSDRLLRNACPLHPRGVVMLVVETGAWLPPKKEPAKPDEKKSAPLPSQCPPSDDVLVLICFPGLQRARRFPSAHV